MDHLAACVKYLDKIFRYPRTGRAHGL